MAEALTGQEEGEEEEGEREVGAAVGSWWPDAATGLSATARGAAPPGEASPAVGVGLGTGGEAGRGNAEIGRAHV